MRLKSKPIFLLLKIFILAKLEWFRAGGETSERQWRDIIGVLDLQGDRLDFIYLQTWATRLGILDLLQRAIQASQGKEIGA